MTRMHRLVLALATAAAAPLAHAAPIALTNAGFEANWTATVLTQSDGLVTFNYGPTGPNVGWSFGPATGVAGSYALLNAYEGSRFALLQGASQTLTQSFDLATDMDVDLSFQLALRPSYRAGQVVRVTLDGQTIADVATGGPTWQLHSLDLGLLSAGTHELAFQGLSPFAQFGDTTAFLDDVRLDGQPHSVPEPASLPLALLATGLGLAAWRRRER